jgi:hypothetical protein
VRVFRALLAVFLVVTQAGCADILWWPGFESPPGIPNYPEQIPAAEVAQQVRCELAQFLREEETAPQFLDSNKGAQIQLKLTTDLQGSASYLGINLKSLGLGAVANLITTSNNIPTLQLKAQGKSTQTSQVDFVVPQTLGDSVANKKAPDDGQQLYLLPTLANFPKPSTEIKDAKDDDQRLYILQKLPKRPEHSQVIKDGYGIHIIKPGHVFLPENLRLPTQADCYPGTAIRFIEHNWFRLWLANALDRYKKNFIERGYQVSGVTFADRVCQPKLTISTQFQLLFDISAGTNIFQSIPIILPISGVNLDASPDYTHFIQIIFSLRPDPNRADACAALQPSSSASTK